MKRKWPITWIAIALSCVLVLIPVFCSVVYFTESVTAKLETTARETASFYLNQYAKEASSILDTLRNSSYYLISDSQTNQFMRQEGMPSQMEQLEMEEGLSRVFLLGNMPDSHVVTGIYLFKDSQQYFSILRSGIFQGTVARMKQVYEESLGHNSARDLYTSPSYPDYCYYIVGYLDIQTMEVLGKIIIELNSANFITNSNIDSIYQEAAVLLRDLSGKAIAGTKDLAGDWLGGAAGYLTVNGCSYYRINRILYPNNLQIDLLIPRSEIFETINDTIKVSIFFTVMALLITWLVGIPLLYFVFKPFKQITQKLDRLAAGDLKVRMDPTPYRETNQIATAFNEMTGRLAALFDEVYHKGLLLREAEFNLLESQIRPHFIFNILELINMRCMALGQQDICQIVSNLAQLLRSNIIHKYQQTITFADELQYVRYYLMLQKERFGDNIDYAIELEDPVILQYYLPKLTIQPLVENSIVHGLENKREGGYVYISVWEEVDSVCIRIVDNGIGFDVAGVDLNQAGHDGATLETAHNHVALTNIKRRLQLLYGEPYGMSIASVLGSGTEILLVLPVNMRGDGAYAKSDDC